MSSSVYFKFKSQKEPSRVTFDGTGISVFELKRQIIQINRLGDGSDFDLAIYNQDTNDEYSDDTTIIPRSTSIIARRLPPIKAGRGTAQRYVSGKMPMNALPNAARREKNIGTGLAQKKQEVDTANGQNNPPGLTGGESEEDMIAAMFQAQSEQWNKTQEQLATATPVYRGGAQPFKKNVAPAPSHPPPAGYVCYRCGEKGHWIQQCPTNADPNYDGRPRVKRTTGIPRSFLKTVDKPLPPSNDDSSTNPQQNPTSVMVNSEGEYVVAQPDQASWESYQKKAGTTSKPDAPKGDKALQDMGIECSLCSKLMRDAVKTPCCGKVYCEECIQNALLETDFICPSCEAKEILLDALITDADTRRKVDEYRNGKDNGGNNTNISGSGQDNQKSQLHTAVTAAPVAAQGHSTETSPAPPPPATTPNKKRPAEDDLGPEVPRGPAAMRSAQVPIQQFSNSNSYGPIGPGNTYNSQTHQAFQQQYPQHGQSAIGAGYGTFQGVGSRGPGVGVPMNNHVPVSMNVMNNMDAMHSGYGGYNNGSGYGYNQPVGFSQAGYMQGHNGFNGGVGYGMNGNMVTAGYGMPNQVPHNFMFQGPNCYDVQKMEQVVMGPGGYGYFPNQQKTVFSEPFPSEEDSAYMRKPVNPHRHARPKRIRPSDFKAVGGEMM